MPHTLLITATVLAIVFSFGLCVFSLWRYPKVVALTIAGYLLAGTFIVLAVGTSLIIKGVRYLETFGYYEDIATPVFYFLLAYFWFYVVYALAMLIASYRRSDGIRRRQMLWLLFASTIAFVGAGTDKGNS